MNQKPSALQPAGSVGDELDGAGAGIADGLGGGDRRRAHARTQIVGHARRRRFLDHLLMAALQRAVAFVQMNRIATLVGKNLDLDVARRRDIFLDQHTIVAEGGRRFAPRTRDRGIEIGMAFDQPHALAATAGNRLDQHRIAEFIGLALQERIVLLIAVIARHHRHAGLAHQRLGAVLQPHRADRGRRRTDKDHAGLRTGLGEVGILREEAVTGMEAGRAALLCDRQQFAAVEIAFARRRRPDEIGLVALTHMRRIRVGIGINRDGPQSHPARRARDPARDLAAIGNQYRGKHESPARIMARRMPAPTRERKAAYCCCVPVVCCADPTGGGNGSAVAAGSGGGDGWAARGACAF